VGVAAGTGQLTNKTSALCMTIAAVKPAKPACKQHPVWHRSVRAPTPSSLVTSQLKTGCEEGVGQAPSVPLPPNEYQVLRVRSKAYTPLRKHGHQAAGASAYPFLDMAQGSQVARTYAQGAFFKVHVGCSSEASVAASTRYAERSRLDVRQGDAGGRTAVSAGGRCGRPIQFQGGSRDYGESLECIHVLLVVACL
jgi:hypothetical protein